MDWNSNAAPPASRMAWARCTPADFSGTCPRPGRRPGSRASLIGLMVAMLFLPACGDYAPVDSSGPGTLSVAVDGLDPGAPDGGSISVTGIGGQTVTLPIPTTGNAQSTFANGKYFLEYKPPEGHTIGPGSVDTQ